MDIAQILTVSGILLISAILLSKYSAKLGVPSLILFIIIGMLAGSDGLGKIHFTDAYTAQFIGTIALIYILFSGGLDTKWTLVKPIARGGFSLATIGVLVTAISVGIFSVIVLKFSLLQGFLLGAIISSTDAAAVFATLRAKSVDIHQRLKSLVELESGSNDPMAIFLTLIIIQAITNPQTTFFSFIVFFVMQMIVGSLLGLVLGFTLATIINKLHFDYSGLYSVFILSAILVAYGLVSLLGGNGFLAIYLIGLILGNSSINYKKSILEFYDGIAWLMQIVMFIVLGLLVFPSQLILITFEGILISLFLIFTCWFLRKDINSSTSNFSRFYFFGKRIDIYN